MADSSFLHRLGARLAPEAYLNRYLDNVAKACDVVLLPGDDQPRSLESFYLPLHLRDMTPQTRGTPGGQNKTQDIWDALFRSPRLAIVGESGAGKTSTLKHATATLARKKMPEAYVRRLTFLHLGQAFASLLPIYADLSQADPGAEDLLTILAEELHAHGFPAASGFLRDRFSQGGCILFLDGINRLTSDATLGRIKDLLATYPRLLVVIATRTFRTLSTLPAFAGFECLPFTASNAVDWIGRRFDKDSHAAASLSQAIERNAGLRTLAENPWLLSILASVKAPAPSSILTLQALYEQCLRVLIAEGTDAASNSGQSSAGNQPRQRAVQQLGLYAHERHLEQFSEQEIRAAIRLLPRTPDALDEATLLAWITHSPLLRQNGGESFSFLRQALQEYLAAQTLVARGPIAEVVRNHAGDPWWHEVLVNVAALQGNAAEVIENLQPAPDQSPASLLLAARCAIEAPNTPPEVRQRLRVQLFPILQTEDSLHWRQAALCIAAFQGQRISEFFPRALREGSIQERQNAALAMGRVGSPDWATIPLLGALDVKFPEPVRRQAAWALGQLKDKRAVQPLMAVLRDNPDLAAEAATALSVIAEPAVPPLTAVLSSSDTQVRQMAVKSLGKMGATALRPLLEIVQDEKRADQVIKGAAEALGLLGDAQAVPALAALLRSRRGKFAEPAANALAGIGVPAVQSLIEALPAQSAEVELRQSIISALVAISLPSVPALTQALDSPSTAVRTAAEDALKGIGAPANQALLQTLRGGDLNLRRRIAEILENTGDAALTEPLIGMLADRAQDSGVRVRAMHILAKIAPEQAVSPLIEAMQRDREEVVRREAVRTLMDIKSERAVGPLIDTLQDGALCDQATAALSTIGEPAVEPLILAVNEGRNSGLRQAAIKALSNIGAGGRIGEPTLAALARVYSRLLGEQHTPDALLALIENIRWWKHGEELYQAFNSAKVLAQAQDLDQVARSREALAWWMEGAGKPFRPGIRKILQDLNSIAQDAAIYLSNPDRDGQRNAMVSTIDRLTGIQETIDTQLLEFEKGPFTQVVEGWRRLTEEAIKNLRGRAQLAVDIIRDDIVLDSGSVTGTVVFSLTNTGASAARNLTATLRRGSKDGFEVVGSATQRLEPLGTGMQKEVEFTIRPLGVTQATYALEVSYDDDEAENRFYPISGQLRFHSIDREYRPIPFSPYNWGPPVKTPHMFYGRQDVFAWINENIGGPEQPNILVLHGERRMGKTSILYQLQANPPTPQHVPVLFSLELAVPKSIGDFLLDLTNAIREKLIRSGTEVSRAVESDFMSNAQRAFRHYYYEVVEPSLGERRLLVMVDEIDILLDKVESGALSEDTLKFLRGLMQHSSKIAFVFTGAYKLRETLKDNHSILFNIARAYEISYLGQVEAEALITEPVAQYLNYDDLTVRTIVDVTAGHPYFIQYICDSLVKLARRLKKNWVFKHDVQVVLQDVVQDSSGVLQSAMFAPLSRSEQIVLAGLANVTDENRVYVLPETVAQRLEQSKLSIPGKDLLEALRSLRERDLVVEQKSGQSLMYRFKMGLIRMWLCQNEVLLRLSQEMKV